MKGSKDNIWKTFLEGRPLYNGGEEERPPFSRDNANKKSRSMMNIFKDDIIKTSKLGTPSNLERQKRGRRQKWLDDGEKFAECFQDGVPQHSNNATSHNCTPETPQRTLLKVPMCPNGTLNDGVVRNSSKVNKITDRQPSLTQTEVIQKRMLRVLQYYNDNYWDQREGGSRTVLQEIPKSLSTHRQNLERLKRRNYDKMNEARLCLCDNSSRNQQESIMKHSKNIPHEQNAKKPSDDSCQPLTGSDIKETTNQSPKMHPLMSPFTKTDKEELVKKNSLPGNVGQTSFDTAEYRKAWLCTF